MFILFLNFISGVETLMCKKIKEGVFFYIYFTAGVDMNTTRVTSKRTKRIYEPHGMVTRANKKDDKPQSSGHKMKI